MMFNGLHVIESIYLTKAGTPYEVRRSWRERLFTIPWRPWQATRTVIPQVPIREAFQFGNSLVMHPDMWRELQELARARGQR